MLTIVITLMAVTLAAIPWCSNFPLMLVVNTLNAVFSGGLDVGECWAFSPDLVQSPLSFPFFFLFM